MIVIMTIPESFQIIICYRSNFNSELLLLLLLFFFLGLSCTLSMFLSVCVLLFFSHFFNVFVYLYRVVNLSNELDFHLHFAYQIKNTKKY